MINYDVIRQWEKIPSTHDIVEPIMEFGIYKDGLLYDNKKNKLFYFYYDKNRIKEIKFTENNFEDFEMSEITENLDKEGFAKIVNQSKKYIHDGDIFQVVLSRRFGFQASGDYLKVYKILRKLNPSPYMYHMKMNEKTNYWF